MNLPYVDPFLLAMVWPEEKPLLFLGGREGKTIFALDFEEVSLEALWAMTMGCCLKGSHESFGSGYMGFMSYDDFHDPPPALKSKIFRVFSSITFDHHQKTVVTHVDTTRPPIDFKLLEDCFHAAERYESGQYHPLELTPLDSDQNYLDNVKLVQDDIRDGRYYQLNLIRYFDVKGDLSRVNLLTRLREVAGPYSSFADVDGFKLCSFSPEQFVTISSREERAVIKTFPIKGTIGRDLSDPEQDEALKKKLADSQKDRCELNIIIDLLRNDLNRVSERGSVQVEDPGSVKTFEKVHHLVAEISSRLRSGITFKEFLTWLMPGGSITGAPKKEVMKSISELEKRQRGFFMGTAFYLTDEGVFDSSILIRTLVKSSEGWQYAAGSGLTLLSDPQAELDEIIDKCRVLVE